MKLIASLIFLATLPLFLLACASKAPITREITYIPTIKLAPKMEPTIAKVTPTYEIPVQMLAPAPYLDPQNTLFTERSFYFETNSSILMPEFARVLEIHGKFLAANPKVTIVIEGSADERGKSDLNFTLGKVRAMRVAYALKAYGVSDRQMKIISVGRYEPKVTGHTEAAWSKNRRVDLIYPTI